MSDYISTVTKQIILDADGNRIKQTVIHNQSANKRIKAHDFIFRYNEDAEDAVRGAILNILLEAIIAVTDE